MAFIRLSIGIIALMVVALRTVNAITATWVGCAVGMVATAPFAVRAVDEIAAAPPVALVGVVFLGIGPTAVAFLTWAYALNRTDAGTMAATTLAVPAAARASSRRSAALIRT